MINKFLFIIFTLTLSCVAMAGPGCGLSFTDHKSGETERGIITVRGGEILKTKNYNLYLIELEGRYYLTVRNMTDPNAIHGRIGILPITSWYRFDKSRMQISHYGSDYDINALCKKRYK